MNKCTIKITFRINKYSQVSNKVSTGCAGFTKFTITNQCLILSEKVITLMLLMLRFIK
jgi:hypothetical protein